MWTTPGTRPGPVRHETAQGEVHRLEWIRHNGENFGIQRLRDLSVLQGDLYTSFVTFDAAEQSHLRWIMSLKSLPVSLSNSVTSLINSLTDTLSSSTSTTLRPYSLVFYFGAECPEAGTDSNSAQSAPCLSDSALTNLHISKQSDTRLTIQGFSRHSGHFRLTLQVDAPQSVASIKVQSTESHNKEPFPTLTRSLSNELKNRAPTGTTEAAMHNRRHRDRSAENEHHFVDEFGEFKSTETVTEQTGTSTSLADQVEEETNEATRFLAFQIDVPPETAVLLSFEEHLETQTEKRTETETDLSALWTQTVQTRVHNFDAHFDSLLPHDTVTVVEADKEAIKTALSSLLGGMGLFQGKATVASQILSEVLRDVPPSSQPQQQEKAIDNEQAHEETPTNESSYSNKDSDLQILTSVAQSVSVTPDLTTLLTSTPSRTVFPRGFLWDEGFHQLVTVNWNRRLTLSTLSSWLTTGLYLAQTESALYLPLDLNHNRSEGDEGEEERAWVAQIERETVRLGWIPREMILGEDALHRVPAEFIPQRVDIANPPTFFLVLQQLLKQSQESDREQVRAWLIKVLPALHQWLQWFLRTQQADNISLSSLTTTPLVTGDSLTQANEGNGDKKVTEEAGFRWRGRSLSDEKYIPNTLSSGLDDYPRGLIPSGRERHVDLHAWMVLATRSMTEMLREVFGDETDTDVHTQTDADSDTDSAQPTDPLSSLRRLHRLGYYDRIAVQLRRTLDTLHWQTGDLPGSIPGYYDVGITNEALLLGQTDEPAFVRTVLCRCVHSETRSHVDGYLPESVLQMIMNYYQQRQRGQDVSTLPPPPQVCPPSHPQFVGPLGGGQGPHGMHIKESINVAPEQLTVQPLYRRGYVALFPFLLQLIDPVIEADKMDVSLRLIEPEEGEEPPKPSASLYTPYGIRSMAPADAFYQRRNAPGDAPYWRGPIWININYLTLRALHHYSQLPHAHQTRCQALYQQLRQNVLSNVLKEYHRTGFFWEQYDDQTGEGIRGHPFTGWTATIVNMYLERY